MADDAAAAASAAAGAADACEDEVMSPTQAPEVALRVEVRLEEATARIASLEAALAHEQQSKLEMAQELAELQGLFDTVTHRCVDLQVANQEMVLAADELRSRLARAERAEAERAGEVVRQTQRLSEVEEALRRKHPHHHHNPHTAATSSASSTPSHGRPAPASAGGSDGAAASPATPPAASGFSFNKITGALKGALATVAHHETPLEAQRASLPEHAQAVLSLRGNGACADCGLAATLPLWVATDFSVAVCTRCAGVHRGFGGPLRSLTLDRWTNEQIDEVVGRGGNTLINERLLARLPEDERPPTDEAELEKFLARKYCERCYVLPDSKTHSRTGSSDGELVDAPAGGSSGGGSFHQPPGGTWMRNVLTRLSGIVKDGERRRQSSQPPSPLPQPLSPAKVFVPAVSAWRKKKEEEGEEVEAHAVCCDAEGLPEDDPDLELVRMQESEVVATAYYRSEVAKVLPSALQRCNWMLAYSDCLHGASLRALYHAARRSGPYLLLLRTTDGDVLGAYSHTELELNRRYYGVGETLVFRFHHTKPQVSPTTEETAADATADTADSGTGDDAVAPASPADVNASAAPECECWGWSGANEFFVLSQADLLAYGGGNGSALCLDASLGKGTTDACDTFSSPPLVQEKKFCIQRLELWKFTDDDPPAGEEEVNFESAIDRDVVEAAAAN